MSKYKTIYTEVEVEVDISEFDTKDLIDELEERGEFPSSTSPYDSNQLVEQIWMRRRNGQDYQRQLDDLIYQITGHIV